MIALRINLMNISAVTIFLARVVDLQCEATAWNIRQQQGQSLGPSTPPDQGVIEFRTGRTTIPPTRKVSVCIQYPHCSESGLSLISRNEKNMSKCKADQAGQRKFSVSGLISIESQVLSLQYDLSHVLTTPSRPASANPVATVLKTMSIAVQVQVKSAVG